ncbi:trichoplein keratin filament-binding protein isoform X1 [Delphinus delphis]|uniref:Trichoplein keratin filament-binding protein n=1 Tax=Tursiops truncatus TaxID=9739 RepID=A0A2U4CKZ3_TURTR|nr:trichoplein keratin filament-binding protein [Tursiops truncatus]XP_019806117.1 trichoplein keratin filament-binding protein [Tursiops truncatus]XP_059884198.1 trichoplein keratin filament-binding protein isoform X1 [Delphinus delphis]XP_059884199.1 trichoplein keratin filament-binding protein isoform X1 [Delphinus delphis]
MALPTLPSSWCSRRLPDQQAARQQRREQEAQLRQQWDQNSRYFKVSDICSSKQAEWSSKASYQRSMYAYQREKMKEEGRKRLEARRQRLRQLLAEEQDLLARELEELRLSMNLRERRIREQHRNLKSAREEQRKLIAEQLLHEHWKKNNPKLREIELELHKKHVINSWETQKEEKKQQEAAEEEKEKRYENEYEMARREALERMKAEEERRQLEGKLQADALRQQMEELKVKEMEATKLKKEQENLLKQRWELERLEEERKQMAALWQKAELGRFLRHQYNVQLNRRTQQIQEELEADRRILQALLKEEDETQRVHLARREQAQADVAWMKRVIEEQLQLERAREAELQMLLREEAKEMWEKREAEWARERSARDRLMSEVLTGRQKQIQEKIEQNRREQEESLRHREQLIRDLEEARESAHREKKESEELKSARKQELEAQVAERQLQAWEADQQEEEEEEEARQAEQLTDALLQQEAKMMTEQGYRPKPYGHPRIAWN